MTDVKTANRHAVSVQSEQVALSIDRILRAIDIHSWRYEPRAGRAERTVVLAGNAILRTQNYIVAQFPAIAAEIQKRDPRTYAEENIVVVRPINQNERAHDGGRVGLSLGLNLQT